MKPSRSKKRRRLVQSYVLPQGPDLPARFESLNDDTLTTVLEFLGGKSYRSFGGLTKHCKEVYLNTPGMTKETFLYGYGPLTVITDKIERAIEDDNLAFVFFNPDLKRAVCKGVVFYNRRDVLAWALQERKKCVLGAICNVATGEGRIDILKEVWNNIDDEDAKKYVFRDVDTHAAENGKLDVLKWTENKELRIKVRCAGKAAEEGHLNILQWLQEKKGLELDGNLYNWAISGDQFHIMKWLKEQEVDWGRFTFSYAVREKGNLDILQWLHDKGCPWPDNDDISHVDEGDLEPEVVEWCRVNGYGDRITLNRFHIDTDIIHRNIFFF